MVTTAKGVEMQSQVWWKELASMVTEAEHRQEARLQEMLAGQEAKFQGIMDELKSLIAGLNCQDVETAERRHWDEQVPIANNNASGNSWNSFAKLEFPHFGGEGLEGWLLRAEYFFEVGRIEYEKRVKVVALHLEG
ncbi:hypothetical protein GH714_019562 [Hevea brasiliensis]|uniref:Retrotransposon gag domain-containing protein n=1 Tax=Hevea brasiliensis TaxID=3981 RepID=A0A6A6KSZ0_HEVBR|nr:hypothetical protein GH714_019562 [Hevea brasiliensis]